MSPGGRAPRRCRASERELSWLAATLAHSVRSGATLIEAIAEAVHASSQPQGGRSGSPVVARGLVHGDLVAVLDATRRGRRVDDALDTWRRTRADDPSIALLVAACRFGHATGGDLAAALDGVSLSLLDRVEAADEARALASQARSSAAVLVALPLVGVVGFTVVDPAVGRTLLGTTAGRICLGVGLTLEILGALVMSRLVRAALR